MKHLIGRVDGVWIARSAHLEKIMNRIAEKCGFSRAFHQFEPHGTTGVLVLSESHSHISRENEFAANSGKWEVIMRM